MAEMGLRRTALYDDHVQLGAKLVEFGGWEMPLSYGEGTVAEHKACREGAVVFDVSHLGTVALRGPDSYELLQRTLTNDLAKVSPGRAQHPHLLEDQGSVVDDIIIWWCDPESFDVMPNASNTDRVTRAIAEVAMESDSVLVDAGDVTSERAILAVQGPQARELLRSVDAEIASVGRFDVRQLSWNGITVTVAGTGYTGEDGVEIAVPSAHASELWNAILEAGVIPAGLGARDTLRLEAGLPLHGHELGEGITSLQAGLGWAVRFEKGPFRGAEALVAERDRGVTRRLVGLVTPGRRPPREGSAVLRDGVVVGEVTSGNYSPQLGHGIALAFVPPETAIGDEFVLDVRGTDLEARVVKTPFVS